MKKLSKMHDLVAAQIRGYPDRTFSDIAHDLGISVSTVSRIAHSYGLSREFGLKIKLKRGQRLSSLETQDMETTIMKQEEAAPSDRGPFAEIPALGPTLKTSGPTAATETLLGGRAKRIAAQLSSSPLTEPSSEVVLTTEQLSALRDRVNGGGKRLLDLLVDGAKGRAARCTLFSNGTASITFQENGDLPAQKASPERGVMASPGAVPRWLLDMLSNLEVKVLRPT